MPALILALAVIFAPCAGAADADKDTVEMVEAFIKLPVDRLPVEHIDRFVAVDPETLPKKLRQGFKAKKLELYTFKQLAHRKKVGTIISGDDNCAVPHEGKSNEISVLLMVGYQEITEDEKIWVGNKTKCTERDMLCEFSLQVVDEKGSKKKAARRRYFLYCKASCDPLMVLIGAHRDRADGKQTNFFGMGAPVCTR
ncbi:MAG: hypothetical protein HY077_01115 [Elusimicrobia bacterium]|nr:hypothetical protein [Elusimicrobiota bacterium]